MRDPWVYAGTAIALLAALAVSKRGRGRVRPVVPGGRVTSTYLVERTPTHLHRGVDIAAPTGTPVRAMRAGTILENSPDGRRSGYGNAVLLEHDDGSATFYAHLSGFAKREGARVRQGDVIGYVGSTQAPRPPMTSKPHLHLETHQYVEWGDTRPVIHETAPPRFDPREYAAHFGVPLVTA